MKPEVHMIAITDNPISMHYRDICAPSWTDHGYTVRHFEALTPVDIVGANILNITKKMRSPRREVEFTETERAVWYSHYYSWMLCRQLDTPIIVAEHDIMLLDDLDEDVFNYDIACLSHVTRSNGKTAKLAGGAYYITPRGAKILCGIKNKSTEIIANSDAWIHRTCDDYGKWFMFSTTQIQDPEIGVTVIHNK
jgi:hypothetical protein